jgi:diacylglycerol kinase (ATP)
VVAVGGDGTVSHVARGLAGSDTALGIIPAGNGNDFSRAIGVPTAPAAAARLALEARPRAVDLGRVHARREHVAFVNVAGCGFDAEVLRRTRAGGPAGGAFLYFGGILRTLSAFRPLPMRLTVDGRILERRVLGVAVANGPAYGGGMRIAPHALLDDGLLDVLVVGDVSRLQLLALLPRMYSGTHVSHHLVESYRCRQLTVEPLVARYVGCQADGELLEQLPATFSVEPRGLLCVAGADG